MVRGAPSLASLFADLAREYEKQNPQVHVIANFVCPPCVMFRAGAEKPKLDVFAALGDFEIARLRRDGQVDLAYTKEAGRTPLALVTSRHVKSQVRGIPDLHRTPLRRIGVGDPAEVAVGYYTKRALEKTGLWHELEGRLVYGRSGCELLKWLGLGRDIDAAIVFAVCVTSENRTVYAVQEFPPDMVPPVPLIVGVAKDCRAQEEARRFVDFVADPATRPLLARYSVRPVSAHD